MDENRYDGDIPVNLEDLPVSVVDMEESGVYETRLKSLELADKLSKKGVLFCKGQFEVVKGDYEGYTVFINYLPVPVPLPSQSEKARYIAAVNNNAQFAKMAAVFGVKGPMPSVNPMDMESRRRWQDWINSEIEKGRYGKMTIFNNEYPAGSGRKTPQVNDFVYS